MARGKRPQLGFANPRNLALLTDLYEVTMAQSYWRLGMNDTATFDLFVRETPPNRRFLVCAGVDHALAALHAFRFDGASLDYLRSLDRFDDDFLKWLAALRFTGEVWALAEGEVFFATEPLLRVTAPLIEAQLVETLLLNTMLYPSAVASKAARVVIAASGHSVVEFGARRAQGADASVKAARASYLAGCDGTSNLLAGRLYGIPVYGTMAHSYVMAFEREIDAFRAYAEAFPEGALLLIDTYDTLRGAARAAEVGAEMRARGQALRGVRLDSGDIATLAPPVRRILDEAGSRDAQIFVSGDLNEWRIDELVSKGCPVDAFGVGTEMTTSKDAPALGGVYKLVEYSGTGRLKRSPGKRTLPGRKQIWREAGCTDTVGLEHEHGSGTPLLASVMKGGRAAGGLPSLPECRARCLERLGSLPAELRDLSPCDAGAGPVPRISDALREAEAAVSI
jgi:nicotinate phosphoribosyltransferase